MAAAPTSDLLPAFPTLASLNSDPAAFTSVFASSEFGCPNSDFVSLGSQCALSSLPSCVADQITAAEANPTATSINYDAACCTSLSVYAVSLRSCFSKNAPSCLDTSALLASATAAGATATASNPCAQYFGKGGGSGSNATPAPSAKGASGATGTSGGSPTATQASGAGTSGGSTTAAKGSGASKVGAGLKVYLGLGLIGALAVLTV